MGFYLNNPDRIHIISDRQESVVEFFQGHRIVVAMVTLQDLNKTLTTSQVIQNNCFVAYPSFNYDGSGKITTYGLSIKLAPVSLEVIQIWKKHQPKTVSVKIFLEQDPEDSELYHFVGWTEAERFSFSPEDSVAFSLKPQNLWYRERQDTFELIQIVDCDNQIEQCLASFTDKVDVAKKPLAKHLLKL